MTKPYKKDMKGKQFNKYVDSKLNEDTTKSISVPKRSYGMNVKTANRGKQGWYDESYRHKLAALGISSAIDKRNEVKTATTRHYQGSRHLQGSEKFDDEPPTELVSIYIDELHDSLNENNRRYESGEISSDEHERAENVIVATANFIHERRGSISDDDLTDVMRQSRGAQRGSNEMMFYYNIGKIEKGADYTYNTKGWV